MRVTALIACLCVSQVFAFWSTGHMIIAKIAENELMASNPKLFEIVDNEVKILSQWSKEKGHEFVESSTWADDNKGVSWAAFNGWHFVDTPIIEAGWHGETEYDPENATWALNQSKRTLSDTRKHSMDDGLSRSFMLRYLIHVVGDIHQPLHGAAYYSDKFPKGDRGGNSWKVTYNKEIDNLHKLWDSCVDQYGSIWTPISDHYWETLEGFAKDLTQQYPRDHSEIKSKVSDLKFENWAKESHKFAEDYVYDGIEPSSTPSPEYIERGREKINA